LSGTGDDEPASEVRVREVVPNSPAAKVRLRSGDIIVKFAGQGVNTAEQLEGLVQKQPVGSRHQLAIRRGVFTYDFEVVVGDAKGPDVPRKNGQSSQGSQFENAFDGTNVDDWPSIEEFQESLRKEN
jgi:S1-C subfamily serine protease